MNTAAGKRRKRTLAGAGAALAIAAGLSPAWACTATPFLTIGPTQSGAVGTELTANVYAANGLTTGRAEIRLIEHDALTRTLASTNATAGKDFTVPFTVPDVPSGVQYLALENGGKIIARAAFEVLRPGQAQVDGALRRPDPRPSNGVSPAVAGAGVAGLGVIAVAGFGLATSRRRRTIEITNS